MTTDKEPALKVIAMPQDTNPAGDMFGGWIVSMIDLAGWISARKAYNRRYATVAMDGIRFHNPVFVGDCVECYTEIEKVGNTSITVKVEVYVERMNGEQLKVTEGRCVYVAIGEDRKPVSITPLQAVPVKD